MNKYDASQQSVPNQPNIPDQTTKITKSTQTSKSLPKEKKEEKAVNLNFEQAISGTDREVKTKSKHTGKKEKPDTAEEYVVKKFQSIDASKKLAKSFNESKLTRKPHFIEVENPNLEESSSISSKSIREKADINAPLVLKAELKPNTKLIDEQIIAHNKKVAEAKEEMKYTDSSNFAVTAKKLQTAQVRIEDLENTKQVALEKGRKELEGALKDGNFDVISANLLDQIPKNIQIDLKQKVIGEAKPFNFNNYALAPDKNIKLEEQTDGTYLCALGDKEVTLPKPAEKTEEGHLLVAGGGLGGPGNNCDVSTITTTNGIQSSILCDGCNWGIKPKKAAEVANKEASVYFTNKIKENPPQYIHEVGKIRLESLDYAHKKIMETAEGQNGGGTTFTCMDRIGDDALITSVGDTKVYIIRTDENGKKTCFEVTAGTRGNITDASQSGGRIGSWSQGKADYRNLSQFYVKLQKGDVVVMGSDGVHDNLDPIKRGLKPSDFNLSGDKWEDNNPEHLKAVQKFSTDELLRIQKNSKNDSEAEFSNAIKQHVNLLTAPTKIFMMQNPSKGEPKDYVNFPGKMDHVGHIIYKHEG